MAKQTRRNIAVDNVTYKWTYAKIGAVIWNDQGKQFQADINDLIANSTILVGPKGLQDIAITPGMIAKWIKNHPETRA